MADTRNLSNKDKIGIQLDMVTNVLAYALSYRDSYDQDTPEWFGCAMTVHWLRNLYRLTEMAYREEEGT